MEKDFYVYMLAKKKYGTIYKGMSSGLLGRVWQHKNNIGSQFTSKYNVKKLVWYRHCGNWEEAVRWEKRLRRYSRQWKINLIEEQNPEWNDLYSKIAGMDCTHKACNDSISIRDFSKQLGSSLEARMLIKHITKLSDADLIATDDIVFNSEQEAWLWDAIQQRLSGRPISKIIGKKEFYGRDFIVTDDVLDPRPDSETLIDVVLRHCEGQWGEAIHAMDGMDCRVDLRTPRNDAFKILDLGTGSGCLILTLLRELPNSTGVAVDVSDNALRVARQNAEKLGVQDRVILNQSNWFDNIEGRFDVIIANPPYIESTDIKDLQKEVSDYDPSIALDGGEDGLDPYRVILPQIRLYLNDGGLMAFEHGTGQSGRIKRLIENEGFQDIRVSFDLGGHDRVLSAIHK